MLPIKRLDKAGILVFRTSLIIDGSMFLFFKLMLVFLGRKRRKTTILTVSVMTLIKMKDIRPK